MSNLHEETVEPTRASVALYVEQAEPVWDLPVGRELVPRIPVAGEGATALVTGCRTGLTVLQLARMMPDLRRLVAVDEDRELLNQAHATVDEVDRPSIYFQTQSTRSLTFADDVFQLAVCSAGLNSTASLLNGLSALERVVAPEGVVAVAALGGGSFPRIREIFLEALWARGDGRAEELETIDLTAEGIVEAGERCGLELREEGRVEVAVPASDARSLFTHPLVRRELLLAWRPLFPDLDELWEEVLQRAEVWYGDRETSDTLELLWSTWTVRPPVLAIDEDDVVESDAT